MNTIYLDHSSTTPVDPRVKKAMDHYHSEDFGNPGSLHTLGRNAQTALNTARTTVSTILHCTPQEVIFTSGGTESINLAIQGVAHALQHKGKHIITTTIEHPAVRNTCRQLEKQGYTITCLPVDNQGIIDSEKLKQAITPETILITIHYANNEIGTIQDIKTLSALARERNIIFHTDASQAAGYCDINIENLGIDLLTLNGSKIYGPKGSGLLYVRTGTPIKPLFYGGEQEHKLRSGTENIPAIIGFAKALQLSEDAREQETKRLTTLRDQLILGIFDHIPETTLNGHPTQRLPNNVNISINNVEGEALVLHLNEQGIYAATGSACTSQHSEPSHVLLALGTKQEESSVRFSLGRTTTPDQIKTVIELLPEIVKKLRAIKTSITS